MVGNVDTYISVDRILCAMHFLENLLKTAIFIDISRIIELQRPKQPECHWGETELAHWSCANHWVAKRIFYLYHALCSKIGPELTN